MGRRLPWNHPHLQVDYITSNVQPQPQLQPQSQLQSPLQLQLQPAAAVGASKAYKYPLPSSTATASSGMAPKAWSSSRRNQRPTRGRLVQDTNSAPSRPPRTPSRAQRLDDNLSRGKWFCDCKSRQQARRIRVKKEGPNKGRYFWGCSTGNCKFFLWDDDDKARMMGLDAPSSRGKEEEEEEEEAEEAARGTTPKTPQSRGSRGRVTVTTTRKGEAPPVPATTIPGAQVPTPAASNKGNEPKPNPKSKPTTPRDRSICDFFAKTPTTNTTGQAGASASSEDELQRIDRPVPSGSRRPEPTTSSKRKRVSFEEDLISDLSSDEERQMWETVERSSRKLQAVDSSASAATPAQPVTPHEQKTVNQNLPGGLPTPNTSRTLFPEAKRQRVDAPANGTESTESATPSNLGPSPGRQQPLDGSGGVSITKEVMDLLSDQRLEPSKAQAIRQALDRHAARTRGAIKGRDAVRDQLKSKDARIAQLQEKVTALENKTKMQREAITDLKAGMANLYSRH